jgi:hypothetical protein
MKKRLAFALALIISLCVLGSVCVNAGLMWTNTKTAEITFESDGATGYVRGYSGTTNISITLTVYRQNSYGGWTYVGQSSGSSSSNPYQRKVYYTPVSGGYYKAVMSFSVTANGYTESDSVTAYHQY